MKTSKLGYARKFVLVLIPLSSVILWIVQSAAERADDYYPLWAHGLFAYAPLKARMATMHIHRLNEIEYPEGTDFFSVLPTSRFENESVSLFIRRLGLALLVKDQKAIERNRSVIENGFFENFEKITYSIDMCTIQPLEYWKVRKCQTKWTVGRFEVDRSAASK